MNNSKTYVLYLCLILLSSFGSLIWAQDSEHHDEAKHAESGHRLTILMANALIDNSFNEESNSILVVPAFGLNYDYLITPKWGIGFHSDILLEQFKFEKHGHDEEIVRENPIALCGMLLYKPHHRWTIFTGYGVELEKHENFQMIRIGGEYGIELPKNWELGFSIEFDFKPDAYNSLLFGVSFTKILSRKSK